ncbi:MAG: hypothetical protein LBM08_02555, partial [Dysgonamonadaceae bacterium]|nr:hypothetical protein [Dysgonamonadaceae bacterium]
RNKQDITIRRLRYASPTVNRVLSLRDLGAKPCKGGTLLTVGEAEGATCGRDNCYILFISHPLSR